MSDVKIQEPIPFKCLHVPQASYNTSQSVSSLIWYVDILSLFDDIHVLPSTDPLSYSEVFQS